MATLGQEPVVFGSTTIQMILDEADVGTFIMGGKRDERQLTGSFPTDSTLTIKNGSEVTARDQTWKIENYRKGQAMTTVTLIEPNRVEI